MIFALSLTAAVVLFGLVWLTINIINLRSMGMSWRDVWRRILRRG